jgi:hypothetical protein
MEQASRMISCLGEAVRFLNESVRPENPKLFTDLTFFTFLLMLD